jgi:hypothetical protein
MTVEEIITQIEQCSEEDKRRVFEFLRRGISIHPFETKMNATAEAILETIARAPDITQRGVRGILAEATFVLEVIPKLIGWKDLTESGEFPYDAKVEDAIGTVTVQVKMQRKEKGVALIKKGFAIAEVQRTRNGKKDGENTRPYRFGQFDLLAVCMEPSHGRWDSFLYVPERWLNPRKLDPQLIEIMQPVPLKPDEVYTDDFDEAVRRWRSGKPRPPCGEAAVLLYSFTILLWLGCVTQGNGLAHLYS